MPDGRHIARIKACRPSVSRAEYLDHVRIVCVLVSVLYKAAYFDSNANGGAGDYWDYPTGSDTEPTPVSGGTAAGTAVFYLFDPGNGPADIMNTGGLSPYGVMALGGNVWEWEETELDLVNDDSSSFRVPRGGDWGIYLGSASDREYIDYPNRSLVDAADERFGTIGFRVATVPEPSTGLLGALCVLALMQRRRR